MKNILLDIFLLTISIKIVFTEVAQTHSKKLIDEKDIDITADENKIYYDDIKAILKEYSIKYSEKDSYKFHQIIFFGSSKLQFDGENKNLTSNFIVRELENSDFYELNILKSYDASKTNVTTQLLRTKTFFNPSSSDKFSGLNDVLKNIIDFRKMKGEYYFFKGNNANSCAEYKFDNEILKKNFVACSFKQRNINNTFEIGFSSDDLYNTKNISDYKNAYYMNTFAGEFEIFDISKVKNSVVFTKNDKLTKTITDFYSYMKQNNIMPEKNPVDPYENDNSEGGFNLIVRRSLLAIFLTGIITSVIFIGLFIFAKMKKKYPNDIYENLGEN